jgi:membrane protease YdiL (CAAX protease family)
LNFDDDHRFSPEPPEPGGIAPGPVDSATPVPGAPTVRESPAPVGRPVPEDLRAPWNWIDLLLFVLIAFAVTIALGIIVFLGFAAFGVKLSQLRSSPREEGLFTIINQLLMFAALIGYLAVQMRLRFGAPFWRTIGWRPMETGHAPRALTYLGFVTGGFFLAVVVQVASAAFGTKARLPMEALFQDRLVALLILLMAVLVAPVVEETIFRGYIYPVVARSFGQGVGVVATGTLFGLLHASQLWGGWVQIGLLVFVGIVFSYARAVKRTVLASYLLHVSYNFFVSLAFVIGSHWLRALPSGS